MLSKQSKEKTEVINQFLDALESKKTARENLQQEMKSLAVIAKNLQNAVEWLLRN